jgi:hypothetical protein
MTLEQASEGDVLVALKIQGTHAELRELALKLLDASENGEAKCKVDGCKVRISRKED